MRLLFLQIFVIFSVGIFPVHLPAQSTGPSEYELKAAFLFDFAKFVEWPPDAFANPQSAFLVCVLGPDPFGGALDDALLRHSIQGHAVALLRMKRTADIVGCQILFIPASERNRLPEVTAKLRGQSVLVIGENEDFATSGGVIQFALEQNRIRFLINTDAADRSGLKFSSKLLALAKIVRDSPATVKN
jgi:YfiR/HmsC-like